MSDQRALDAYKKGVIAAQRGDTKAALKFYDDALRRDPKMVEAYENRGILRASLNDSKGAFDDYRKGLELDSQRSSLYYNRALLRVQCEDPEAAIEDYCRALILNPDDEEVICNRGVAYRLICDYENAFADFDQALKLDPNDWMAYYNRGCILQNIGELDTAIENFTQALRIKPNTIAVLLQRALTCSMFGNVNDARRDFKQILAQNSRYISATEMKTQLWRLEARSDDQLLGAATATLMKFAYEHCGPRQKNAGFASRPIEDVRWTITMKPLYLISYKGYERELQASTLDICSTRQIMIRVSVEGQQYIVTFMMRHPKPTLPVPAYLDLFTDKVEATPTALREQLENYVKRQTLTKRGNRLAFNTEHLEVDASQAWVFQTDEPPTSGH